MTDVALEANVGPDDPASSLRAAALLTLKRRKPTDGPLQRPTIDDSSVQLDYGQDDIKPNPSNDLEMPSEGPREEGEISDSEDPSLKVSKAMLVAIKSETPLPDREIPSLPPGEIFLDPDHVRPGLSMNQEQYDTAKDIVLDLLGWGVPPDYLVDCNLSREIIYYVFSELNLRLPQNLDVTGLVQYTPAVVAKYSRPLSSTQDKASPLHPSLPAKPLGGPTGSPPSTLHDIERQRRQELLARKAVQASRKIKSLSDSSSTESSHVLVDPLEQDVEMSPAVATEAVDDFLKTIGEKNPEVDINAQPVETMDVDEITVTTGASSLADATTPSFPLAAEQIESPQSTSQLDPIQSPAELDQTLDEPVPQQRSSQRRVGKRPTAADFVDFESGSRNGTIPALKRKTASFASVSSHRKLVIDLSDSEGGDDSIQDVFDGEASAGYISPAPARMGGATPPVVPTSLVEKEEEIRRMRELIAQRERSRLQRAMSRPIPVDPGREVGFINTSDAKGIPALDLISLSMNHELDSETRSATATPPHIESEGSVTTNVVQDSTHPENDPLVAAVGLVDVESTSAEAEEAQQPTLPKRDASQPGRSKFNHFVPYDSMLSSYPFLLASASCSSNPSSLSLSASNSLSISSLSSTTAPLPLSSKLATSRTLILDPTKTICKYEVPGGGICRDSGCNDLHLGQPETVELTDAEAMQNVVQT